MKMRTPLTIVAFVALLWPSAAAGQNREHLQMNADLRILQETVNRLQVSVNRLDAQLAETNKRLDAATAASVKGFADQQLIINQMTSTIATIRERLDDNSVRVSQLSQEFTAVREGVRRLTEQINALVGLLAPPVDGGAPAASATRPAPGSAAPATGSTASEAATARPPLDPVVLPQSAAYIYQQAMGDYMSQRYDSAIEGFREVISDHPDSPTAADAQFQIGLAYESMKDCRRALPEFQKFVDSYPNSDRRHEGLYMIGYCYFDLGQREEAQRAFQQVIREYPNEISAIQAQQRLQGMGVKPQ
jgi:tol-pal system protein YbgF